VDAVRLATETVRNRRADGWVEDDGRDEAVNGAARTETWFTNAEACVLVAKLMQDLQGENIRSWLLCNASKTCDNCIGNSLTTRYELLHTAVPDG